MIVCSACGQEVESGALRCRDCGAPFAGPDAQKRLKPVVKGDPEGAGAKLVFDHEPDEGRLKP